MTDSQTLKIALKEWAVVCQALERGRQILLLRKGGIYEAAGEFELEHRRFLLFPTYLHQKIEMLKTDERGGFEARQQEPQQVRLSGVGEVTDIMQVQSRAQMDALDDQHIWTSPLIDMRFNYRPENPLYLLLVRTYKLSEPRMIANTPAYAGCKSWVPLDEEISIAGATAVLSSEDYEQRRQAIFSRMNSTT
jgi:hypothetical protein